MRTDRNILSKLFHQREKTQREHSRSKSNTGEMQKLYRKAGDINGDNTQLTMIPMTAAEGDKFQHPPHSQAEFTEPGCGGTPDTHELIVKQELPLEVHEPPPWP